MSEDSLPLRYLTLDVEEYFHIEAAHQQIPRSSWRDWPRRVQGQMDSILALLEEQGVRGTFFFLGDVAAQNRPLVRQCADAGHEIASHGHMHDRLHRLTPETFREDLLASKHLLEDIVGKPVLGYRAPTWSITRQTAWAIDVLAEAGFAYDASIFPVRHPWYGIPEAPLSPFYVQRTDAGEGGRSLLELPPLVWRVAGRHLAAAGGGYFRLLPLGLMKQGLKQAASERRPAILYFHPWEFDPDLPRMPLSATGRLRTYTGLSSALRRLKRILAMPGSWQPIAEDLPQLQAAAAGRRFCIG